MKKLLLIIITSLMVILTSITMVKGFKIGGLQIQGIKEIKEEDEQLDSSIQNATKLASTDYQKKIDDLNTEIKKFQSEKDKYNNMVNVSTDNEIAEASQIYNNTMDFLLIRIENHAKTEGVTIDLVVSKSSSGAQNVYNLNFTATGSYAGIEEFITDIEDDSKLGFKIEEFKMTAGSKSGEVKASFVCKDITINGIEQGNNTSTTTTDKNNDNKTNTNDNNNTNNTTNESTANTNSTSTENTTSQNSSK